MACLDLNRVGLMETLFLILLAFPVVMWAMEGFQLSGLLREIKRIIGWYLVVGGAYLIWLIS